jgi:hypothetical protein
MYSNEKEHNLELLVTMKFLLHVRKVVELVVCGKSLVRSLSIGVLHLKSLFTLRLGCRSVKPANDNSIDWKFFYTCINHCRNP